MSDDYDGDGNGDDNDCIVLYLCVAEHTAGTLH